jgi:hypothetical protein
MERSKTELRGRFQKLVFEDGIVGFDGATLETQKHHLFTSLMRSHMVRNLIW